MCFVSFLVQAIAKPRLFRKLSIFVRVYRHSEFHTIHEKMLLGVKDFQFSRVFKRLRFIIDLLNIA